MSNVDILVLTVKNLLKRKLRTSLTILGVLIGTTAIIFMLSLGIAVNVNFEKSLKNVGDITTITIRDPNSNSYYEDPNNSNAKKIDKTLVLNEKAVQDFKKIKDVVAVSPLKRINLQAICGKYQNYFNIIGLDSLTMKDFGFELAEGRLLENGDRVGVIMGSDVPYNFYNPNSRQNQSFSSGGGADRPPPPIDVFKDKIQMSFDYNFGNRSMPTMDDETQQPSAKPYNVKVVGLLTPGDWEKNYSVYMDIKEVEKIQAAQRKYEQAMNSGGSSVNRNNKENTGYESVLIKCKDIQSVEVIKTQLEDKGYAVESYFQILEMMKQSSAGLQGLLGGIGAISLFVAAIGITNTMIMAIYERTKEIGVMKVIGASIKDIRKMFLLEASFIGFIGGVFGILLSLLLSFGANKIGISFLNNISYDYSDKISIIPGWLCMAALVFSSCVGLISGYFPARRATKISALAAIRTE